MKTFDVFLTGGTGFIGRYTINELTRLGRKVGVLARNPEKAANDLNPWLREHGGNPDHVTIIPGDMSKPDLGLSHNDKTMFFGVEDIFNIAASIGWGLNYEQTYKVNVEGPLTLVDMASQCKNLRRFVQVSGYMIGTGRKTQNSLGFDHQKKWNHKQWQSYSKHSGSYESTKFEAHYKIQEACKKQSVPLTIMNPGTLIGDSKTGEISMTQNDGILSLIDQLWTGKLSAIPGKQNDWLPLVPVDYFAAFMARVPKKKETAGQAYWILDDGTPKFGEMLKIISKKINVKSPRFHIPIKLLSFLLRMGLSKITGLSHEGLQFITSTRFNLDDENKLGETFGLERPDIEKALQLTSEFYIKSKYGVTQKY